MLYIAAALGQPHQLQTGWVYVNLTQQWYALEVKLSNCTEDGISCRSSGPYSLLTASVGFMQWRCPSLCLFVCSFVCLSPETRTIDGGGGLPCRPLGPRWHVMNMYFLYSLVRYSYTLLLIVAVTVTGRRFHAAASSSLWIGFVREVTKT